MLNKNKKKLMIKIIKLDKMQIDFTNINYNYIYYN